MAADKKKATRADAIRVARTIGCTGAHEHDGEWMPCSSHDVLTEVSNRAEDDSWLRTIGEKSSSMSGRRRSRRKNRIRKWENLRERTYGVQSVPGVGLVSGDPATAFSGPSGKAFAPFSPEVGEPDVYTSPDAARMRSVQVGCTGIRRYTTRSGRQVWMPCTTGVTYDKLTDQGAYRGRRARLEEQRIQRVVRREMERSMAFSRSKKDARSRKVSATPAKPSERISGSDKNREGSSASVSSASSIKLSAEQVKALATKAREHNAKMREENRPSWTMTSTNALKAVMRRGMGAFSSSHRPNVSSRQQWGMGRVNAFLVMLEKGKPKNPKYTTDNDLLRDGHPWKNGTKALPTIVRRAVGSALPDDGDGDNRIFDGTAREMPAPRKPVGRTFPLMPSVGQAGDSAPHDPKKVAESYAEMKRVVEKRFGKIKTEKQAENALRKMYKRKDALIDISMGVDEDLSPGQLGMVVGLLYEAMENRKIANRVLSITTTGTQMNGSGGRGGYLGVAGMHVKNGGVGPSVDFSPAVGSNIASKIDPNPNDSEGWGETFARQALKDGMPEDEIDEVFGAYVAVHEWGHILHFSKSLEDIGFRFDQDAVYFVGKMNGLSPEEIEDELQRLRETLTNARVSNDPVEVARLARQKFVADNYDPVDDAWKDRPFDGLSDEEVASIDTEGFHGEISGYAGKNSFEMVAEARAAERMGYPIPKEEAWQKMSEWLHKKDAKKNRVVKDELENGDVFIPLCSGIPVPGRRKTSTKALPVDRDRDGKIRDGTRFEQFVGFVTDAVSAAAARRRKRGPVRVNITEDGPDKPKGRAKRVVKEIEDAIDKLKKGEPEKSGKAFKPTGKKVPDRLSPKRIAFLTPSRRSHYRLVQTQREYERAPKPEGEHKAASLDELVRPDGSIKETFDHHGIGAGKVTPERRALHDAIIRSVVFGNGKWEPTRSETPTAWMMGGGPASGKTFLRQGGYFDTPKRGTAVHLDADEIKEMIPEFASLKEEMVARGMDPTAAAAAVHAESTYIQREAMRIATENGFDVVVDSTGDGGLKAFQRRMEIVKEAGYKIKGRIADVPIAMANKEAERRLKKEGRGVPTDVVTDTHIDVARAVLYALQNKVYDDMEIVDNMDHKNPRTIAAMKDGELVIYDREAWTAFVAKALLRSTQDYDDDTNYFTRAGTPESAKRMAKKRVEARKVRTKKIEGVESIIADPVPFLAERLPETDVDYKKVVAVPRAKREEMTRAYERLPEFSEEAREAYEALTEEITEQFKMLTDDLGVQVEFVDEDPYTDPLEMMDDLQNNKRLKVLKTSSTGPHPYWTNEQNDMFRAVHDAFGHAATGRGFDRHGEEAAYQAHSSMVSELARRALLTETRGQNVVVITTGDFPPQKMALLPEMYIKADGQGLPQIQPLQPVQQDVSPPAAEGDFPATADEDNLYAIGRSHHTTGGRRFPQKATVISTEGLYDELGEDNGLPPETRSMIYMAVALGRSLEDSDLDESNPKIEKYYARLKKAAKKAGKGNVLDVPNSAVEILPE